MQHYSLEEKDNFTHTSDEIQIALILLTLPALLYPNYSLTDLIPVPLRKYSISEMLN